MGATGFRCSKPQRGLLVHPRGKPLGQQPPSPMVLIDLVRCCHRSKPASRDPKDAARKRRPALDCSRPPALFSFEGRSRNARHRCRCRRLCVRSAQPAQSGDCTSSESEDSILCRATLLQSHGSICFGLRIASVAVGLRPKSQSTIRVPRDTAAMQCRIDLLPLVDPPCRHRHGVNPDCRTVARTVADGLHQP